MATKPKDPPGPPTTNRRAGCPTLAGGREFGRELLGRPIMFAITAFLDRETSERFSYNDVGVISEET
jgi:hypothetical protein